MKKAAVGVAFALTLFLAVPAHAYDRDRDRDQDHDRQGDSRWGHARIHGNAQTGTAATPASVPEPSSIWMLGSGLVTLAGIGLIRRA
jgi:hypothetical protein